MPITRLAQLLDAVQAKPRKRLAAAFANDAHTIEAVNHAVEQGIVDGTLVGDEAVIRSKCQELGIDPGRFTIIHEPGDSRAAARAVALVRSGECQILMKGLVSTDKYMRAILNKEAGLMDPGAILSHVSVIENAHYPKLIICGDVAVLPYPELKEKVAKLDMASVPAAERAEMAGGDSLDDVASALLNLGYKDPQVRKALVGLDASRGASVEELLKQALKVLMK